MTITNNMAISQGAKRSLPDEFGMPQQNKVQRTGSNLLNTLSDLVSDSQQSRLLALQERVSILETNLTTVTENQNRTNQLLETILMHLSSMASSSVTNPQNLPLSSATSISTITQVEDHPNLSILANETKSVSEPLAQSLTTQSTPISQNPVSRTALAFQRASNLTSSVPCHETRSVSELSTQSLTTQHTPISQSSASKAMLARTPPRVQFQFYPMRPPISQRQLGFAEQNTTSSQDSASKAALASTQARNPILMQSDGTKSVSEPSIQLNTAVSHDSFGKGMLAFNRKDYTAAIPVFESVPDSHLNFVIAQRALGRCYFKLKEYEKAIEHLNKVPISHPSFVFAQGCIGQSYFELEEYEKAIEHFNKVPNSNSNFVIAQDYIAQCYFKLKEYEKAIECFNKVSNSNPNFGQDYVGQCYFKLKEYKKAVEYFNKVPNSHVNFVIVQFSLGRCYFELKEYGKAIEHFNKMPESHPKFEAAQDLLKNCLNQMHVLG
jgi:tetratricopeptide (TPR) repeat protein